MKYTEKILAMLDQDGRLTAAQIARMLDAPEQEIADEIAELERKNIILGYKAMIDWDTQALRTRPILRRSTRSSAA